ncbi:MAG: response regulator [Thermogutta sp.]
MYPLLHGTNHEASSAEQNSKQSEGLCGDYLTKVAATHLPQAVFALDGQFRVIWGNQPAEQFFSHKRSIIGKHFYRDLFTDVQLIRPDYYPLTLARDTGRPSRSVMRVEGPRFYELFATRAMCAKRSRAILIVTVQEITATFLPLERLRAVHEAGRRLTEFPADLLIKYTPDERKELLKRLVLAYLKEVLHFDVFEIRLIQPQTKKLVPFISDGMSREAAERELFVGLEGQGITGYVAATGTSYICEDTSADALYLKGTEESRSSLTVPLIRYDAAFRPVVIGTVNIENPRPRAFSHDDRLFLEIFCRDLVAALNTLELIEAEADVATRGLVEEIHGRVALPVDKIVSKAAEAEVYLECDPERARELLKDIYKIARDLRAEIRSFGSRLPPTEASPVFQSKRVLVVDPDEFIQRDAHTYLEQWGFLVETASTGRAGLQMAGMTAGEGGYDVILAANKLPDMKGWEFFKGLKEMLRSDQIPYIMLVPIMTHDADHNFVKARELGAQYQVGKRPPPPGETSGGNLIIKPLVDILNTILGSPVGKAANP